MTMEELVFWLGNAGYFFKMSVQFLYDYSIMNIEKLKYGMR
jgi:hypothetical protein